MGIKVLESGLLEVDVTSEPSINIVQQYRNLFLSNAAKAKVTSTDDSEPSEQPSMSSPGEPGYKVITNKIVFPLGIDEQNINQDAFNEAFFSENAYNSEIHEFLQAPKEYISQIETVTSFDPDETTTRSMYNQHQAKWGFTDSVSNGWESFEIKLHNGQFYFVGIYSSTSPSSVGEPHKNTDDWFKI